MESQSEWLKELAWKAREGIKNILHVFESHTLCQFKDIENIIARKGNSKEVLQYLGSDRR